MLFVCNGMLQFKSKIFPNPLGYRYIIVILHTQHLTPVNGPSQYKDGYLSMFEFSLLDESMMVIFMMGIFIPFYICLNGPGGRFSLCIYTCRNCSERTRITSELLQFGLEFYLKNKQADYCFHNSWSWHHGADKIPINTCHVIMPR